MATFITTIKFMDQGEKDIQETTKRAASFKATAQKMGVKSVYGRAFAVDYPALPSQHRRPRSP